MHELVQERKPARPAGSTGPPARTRADAPVAESVAYDFARIAVGAGSGSWTGRPSGALRPLVQPKLRVSVPGDPYELEADRVADEVVGALGGVPEALAAPAPPPPRVAARTGGLAVHRMCAACAAGEDLCDECAQEHEEEEPSAGPPAVQRQAASSPPAPEPAPMSRTLLVDDDAAEPAPGQMRKGQFLAQLRNAICVAADDMLAQAGRSTSGCPYIEQWFGVLAHRSAPFIERMARRYAPGTEGAASAADVIPPIVERVRQGVAVWVQTGRVTGVPAGLSLTDAADPDASDGVSSASAAPVQRKARGDARSAPAPSSPRALQSHLGVGRALDASVRGRMESAFGADFSSVRVHSDSTASNLSGALGARAFTVGEHVAFDAGEYRPGTLVGDALIAHELAHVVQQGAASQAEGEAPAVRPVAGGETSPEAAFEEDADRSALGAVASLWRGARGALGDLARKAAPRLRSGVQLQRCRRSVKRCPPGKTWQVVGHPPAGGSLGCLCTWRCLPAPAGYTDYGGSYSGPTMSCDPPCPSPPPVEEVGDDYTIQREGELRKAPAPPADPGSKTGYGASIADPNNPMVAGTCGCLSLDIEGGEQASAPPVEVGIDLAGLHPHAARELFSGPAGQLPPAEGPRVVVEGPAVAGEPVRAGPQRPAEAVRPPEAPALPVKVEPPAPPPAEAPAGPSAKAPEAATPPAKAPEAPAPLPPAPAKPPEAPATPAEAPKAPEAAKPPEQKPPEQAKPPVAGQPPAPAPKALTVEDLVKDDNTGFTDPALDAAYQAYKTRKKGKLSPAEWARAQSTGAPAKRLEALVGPNFRKGAGGAPPPPIDFTTIPTPASYAATERAKDLATVTADRARLLERLGKLPGPDLDAGKVDSGHFAILKGNVGEILARPIRGRVLAAARALKPGAQEWTNMRMKLKLPDGTLSEPKLFSDFFVGEVTGKNLDTYDVGEVKTGSTGGATAQTQTWEWNEGRITDGSVLVLPDGREFTYKPAQPGTPEVTGLFRSRRQLVVPKGAEKYGKESGDKPGSPTQVSTLERTAEELDALVRDVLALLRAERQAQPSGQNPPSGQSQP